MGIGNAEVENTGRALAAGPALKRPRLFQLSTPGIEGGKSVGEQAEKRARICSLFAQSRRLVGATTC